MTNIFEIRRLLKEKMLEGPVEEIEQDTSNEHLAFLKPGDEGFDEVLRIINEQNQKLETEVSLDVNKVADQVADKVKSLDLFHTMKEEEVVVKIPWYDRIWHWVRNLFN
jgi:hypothetical protein